MSLMREETLEAPEAVARGLARTADFARVAAKLRRLDPQVAVLCARGSSAHAGMFLEYLLARHVGVVPAEAMPSLASLYAARQRFKGAAFLAISQSGRSPDLLAQTELARREGAFCVAIVNDAASPLAAACDEAIDIGAGPERSVAATKTVLATLASGMALIDAWAGRTDPSLARLPERLAAAARLDWSALADCLTATQRIFTLGRGPALGLAAEAALKLAETAGVVGLGFSTAEVAHGPMALAGPDFPAFAFLQNDPTLPSSRALLEGFVARGVPVFAAGPAVAGATALPTLPPDAPEPDLLGQLLCFYLAVEEATRRRGRDPDRPPALHKVTKTL